jgi:hypothetical protein
MNTRENFKTDAQWKRWLDVSAFFYDIQKLQNQGITVWHKNGNTFEELGQIKFLRVGKDWHIVEMYSSGSMLVWVGSCHDLNKKTGEFDILYLEQSLKSMKKQFQFKYFKEEVLL